MKCPLETGNEGKKAPISGDNLKMKKTKHQEEENEEDIDGGGNSGTGFVNLDENLLFEVSKHVDARTLGRAACVNRHWHRTVQDERLRELICTRHSANIGCGNQQLKSVVLTLGGFRGLHSQYLWPLSKPQSNSTPSTSSVSSSVQSFASRLILLLTLLPLSLTALAFVLQWKGDVGLSDPATATAHWAPQGSHNNHEIFPGMETFSSFSSSPPKSHQSSNCFSLACSKSPSFPYYRDWKFDFEPNFRPKICITTSTSAGLDQILPWMFYHKVIGVTTFFPFRGGKGCIS